MELNIKNSLSVILKIALILGGIASGAMVSMWAVSMGDSTRYVAKLWITIWLLEFLYFPMPRYRRDWLAHTVGFSLAILLTLGWAILQKYYPILLTPIMQLLYGPLVILLQIGIIYLLSNPEHRTILRR